MSTLKGSLAKQHTITVGAELGFRNLDKAEGQTISMNIIRTQPYMTDMYMKDADRVRGFVVEYARDGVDATIILRGEWWRKQVDVFTVKDRCVYYAQI